MKLYRGPKSKALSDDSHVLVHSAPAPEDTAPWHSLVVIKADVSKAATDREAVAHVVINADDVINWHSSLVKGLHERSRKLKRAEEHIEILHNLLAYMKDYDSEAETTLAQAIETCDEYNREHST